MNLNYHEKDLETKAEWNFFATSHCKGACDGVGGAIKRLARKASMQRVAANYIRDAKIFHEWAKDEFKTKDFDLCSHKDHDAHEKKYSERLNEAITIKNATIPSL